MPPKKRTAPQRGSSKADAEAKIAKSKTQDSELDLEAPAAASTDRPAPAIGIANPTFTTFTIPVKPKPIQCQRSDDPREATGSTSPCSPSQPDLIFTHGAGGDLSATAMVNFAHGFASTGSALVMFAGSMNLASRAKGFESVLAHVKTHSGADVQRDASSIAFGGRSMGARAAVVASSSAPSTEAAAGRLLVLASYPLIGPQGDVRDAILLALPATARVLFVSGDHDSMCPLERLEGVRRKMRAQTWLVTVRGADHGMNLRGGKALKKGTEEVGRECGRIAARWLRERDDGVREMVVRWDGERGKVVGTWGDEEALASSSTGAVDANGAKGGIKRFFSKVEDVANKPQESDRGTAKAKRAKKK